MLGLDPEFTLTAISFFGEDDSTLEKHYLHYYLRGHFTLSGIPVSFDAYFTKISHFLPSNELRVHKFFRGRQGNPAGRPHHA